QQIKSFGWLPLKRFRRRPSCLDGFGAVPTKTGYLPSTRKNMRYCPNCKRLNFRRPVICMYCGRTWNVRLCPRGHVNRFDANFCGQCGNTELTDTSGPSPIWIRTIKWISYLVALIAIIYFVPPLVGTVSRDLIRLLPLFILISIIFIWFLPPSVGRTLM